MADLVVRIVSFATVREALGQGEQRLAVPAGATIATVWAQLQANAPTLAALRGSTRVARNGTLAADATLLEDGDELAFLPPVGGG